MQVVLNKMLVYVLHRSRQRIDVEVLIFRFGCFKCATLQCIFFCGKRMGMLVITVDQVHNKMNQNKEVLKCDVKFCALIEVICSRERPAEVTKV